MSTIRLVLGMVAIENLHLEQLDVKTTFLHGDLEEDLYMIQPEGFHCSGTRESKAIVQIVCNEGFGAAKQILGMRIIRDKANGTLKLSQSEYVKKVLSRFNMNEAKTSQTLHMQWEFVSRFMSRPRKQHWEAVKWILRYLKGSLDTCLCFTGGTAISWASNLQKIVTLSTTEAEYVAATEAGKEMIWLHGFLDELGKKQEMGILHSDSQSAIFLAKNSAFHSKSKHIQTQYHFIRYLVEDKLVILEKICGSKNPTDMLTKGVTIEKLKLCATSIGLLA
ncbi:Retrovirus-related Pol polyprotein from transposon TNT 1-94 [Vitis vinifera]|uniref:Retrovirus-related Pol polyprotein from transposon TNT 1-94 n=1 Tax=Vitis vinifera TaxID=29760 RepID=A0A438FIW5_VITVI|nr:Retrovirus-related Pol polyprotein from transposon TNT 1-94 [Vitis vinifera]